MLFVKCVVPVATESLDLHPYCPGLRFVGLGGNSFLRNWGSSYLHYQGFFAFSGIWVTFQEGLFCSAEERKFFFTM